MRTISIVLAATLAVCLVDAQAFAASNPDLFDKSVLSRWYRAERLASDSARRTFLLPDSGP